MYKQREEPQPHPCEVAVTETKKGKHMIVFFSVDKNTEASWAVQQFDRQTERSGKKVIHQTLESPEEMDTVTKTILQ